MAGGEAGIEFVVVAIIAGLPGLNDAIAADGDALRRGRVYEGRQRTGTARGHKKQESPSLHATAS